MVGTGIEIFKAGIGGLHLQVMGILGKLVRHMFHRLITYKTYERWGGLLAAEARRSQANHGGEDQPG